MPQSNGRGMLASMGEISLSSPMAFYFERERCVVCPPFAPAIFQQRIARHIFLVWCAFCCEVASPMTKSNVMYVKIQADWIWRI